MFLPYTRAASVGSFRRPVAAAAADVTPNTIGWSDINRGSVYASCYDFPDIYDTTSQQITGISTPITLNINVYDPNDGVDSFTVSVSNTSSYGSTTANLGTIPTSTNVSANVSISNNQYLIFRITHDTCCINDTFLTITIKNVSDGNTTLATFYYSAYYFGDC